MSEPSAQIDAKPDAAKRQFTLRQLFTLMTAIAIWLGLIIWFGPYGFFAGLFPTIAMITYFRWPRATEISVVLAIITVLICAGLPEVQVGRGPNRVGACRANLRQIGIALELYSLDHKDKFPPLITVSDSCRPMHSWRTHLLPNIERHDLYEQYDWNEPWNGPVNSQLHDAKLRTFRCPSDLAALLGRTNYLAIQVPGYQPGDPFAVIEVPSANVGFFEPKDITLSEILSQNPPQGVHAPNAQFVHVLWPNGEVELIRCDQLAKKLERLQPKPLPVGVD